MQTVAKKNVYQGEVDGLLLKWLEKHDYCSDEILVDEKGELYVMCDGDYPLYIDLDSVRD